MPYARTLLIGLIGWHLSAQVAVHANEVIVSNASQFNAALSSATPGDHIVLSPGRYQGNFFQAGLSDITIRSLDISNPAILDARGNGEALKLSSARNVTLEHFVIENFGSNGINIDDGGNWPTGKSSNIRMSDIIVRNTTPPTGNRDGIKLSGVEQFEISRVQISNWGTTGSAIDQVGTHQGVIENSRFTHSSLSGGTGVQQKGGSSDIQIRSNYFSMNSGRAIQAGGITGDSFFRFQEGESGFEATRISAAGNIIVGGETAFSWVNIDGGEFRHNFIDRPNDWVARILNENRSPGIVETRNGIFANNTIVFEDLRATINVGSGTHPETFVFDGNHWYKADNPDGTFDAVQLPVVEADGIYGVDPMINPDGAVAFDMEWGTWIVNPHLEDSLISLAEFEDFFLAMPGEGSDFDPLREQPFIGDWNFTPVTDSMLTVGPQSQAYLTATSIPEPSMIIGLLLASLAVSFRFASSAECAGTFRLRKLS